MDRRNGKKSNESCKRQGLYCCLFRGWHRLVNPQISSLLTFSSKIRKEECRILDPYEEPYLTFSKSEKFNKSKSLKIAFKFLKTGKFYEWETDPKRYTLTLPLIFLSGSDSYLN
jgi:hypothetical protein